MDKRLKEIANRVKGIREIKGMSVDVLAKKLKIPKEIYLKYENGEAEDIPVSLLYEIANIFEAELTSLLTGEVPKLHIYNIVRKGKGVQIDRRKEYQYQSLAFNFMHKKMEPLIVTAKPLGNKKLTNFYSHPGQEFNYVLEGKLLVVINGQEITLNKGDSLYFDSGYEHAMAALGDKEAKFLAMIA
jgi:transcriptional regulator with XRE-family HTH domain